MSLKERLKEFEDSINLNKLKSGYVFNKWLFRTSILLMILLVVFIFLVHGQTKWLYISCEGKAPCNNPFVVCDPSNLYFEKDYFLCDEPGIDFLMVGETIPPGFVYGDQPPWIVKNGSLLVMVMLFFSFLLNHLFFNKKKGKKTSLNQLRNEIIREVG